MRLSTLAFATVLSALCPPPSVVRAGLMWNYAVNPSPIESLAQGGALVTGSSPPYNSIQYRFNPGPFNGTASGSSGYAGNLATYSATITSNIAADGSVITASGTHSYSYASDPTQLQNLYAGAFVLVYFTVSTPQSFTVTGSVLNGFTDLTNQTTSTNLYYVNDRSGSTDPVSESGILLPGYDYALEFATSYTVPIPDTGSVCDSGNFNLTFTSAAVPEPSSLCLVGLAACGAAGYCWRRRSQVA
jgi:hypothetical protein